MEYDNDMSGVLFKNDRQREGKRDPLYQGHCEINGQAFWVSGWINSSKDGTKKFMSLRFTPKEVKADPVHKPASVQEDFNDDIPF